MVDQIDPWATSGVKASFKIKQKPIVLNKGQSVSLLTRYTKKMKASQRYEAVLSSSLRLDILTIIIPLHTNLQVANFKRCEHVYQPLHAMLLYGTTIFFK